MWSGKEAGFMLFGGGEVIPLEPELLRGPYVMSFSSLSIGQSSRGKCRNVLLKELSVYDSERE